MTVNEQIRAILGEHAKLSADIASVGDGDDLYAAGMTSHASVTVMLACEDEWDIEFPQHLLKKSTFASVDAIAAALAELEITDDSAGGGVMKLTDDHEGLREVVELARRIGRETAAIHAADVDVNARFPKETVDAFRAEGLLGALIPAEQGGLGHDLRQAAAVVREVGRHCASSAMILAMHHIQVASIVRHGRLAEGAGLRPADRRRAAAAGLGHHRDRHRRQHPQLVLLRGDDEPARRRSG